MHLRAQISEPLCLYDNCLESDGALACVVVSAERARSCAKPPVFIHAFAQGLPAQSHTMVNYWSEDPLSGPATACARKLYSQACDLGHQQGCAGYGSMLYRGQGGSMEREKGKRLIQEACAAGDEWGCERARGYGFPDRRGL